MIRPEWLPANPPSAGKVVIITALSSTTTEQLDAGTPPDAMLSKPFLKAFRLRCGSGSR